MDHSPSIRNRKRNAAALRGQAESSQSWFVGLQGVCLFSHSLLKVAFWSAQATTSLKSQLYFLLVSLKSPLRFSCTPSLRVFRGFTSMPNTVSVLYRAGIIS